MREDGVSRRGDGEPEEGMEGRSCGKGGSGSAAVGQLLLTRGLMRKRVEKSASDLLINAKPHHPHYSIIF